MDISIPSDYSCSGSSGSGSRSAYTKSLMLIIFYCSAYDTEAAIGIDGSLRDENNVSIRISIYQNNVLFMYGYVFSCIIRYVTKI